MIANIHNHFKQKDAVLYACLCRIGDLEPLEKDIPQNYFFRLCREIIGQQLSDASSSAIISRFEGLFGNTFPKPADVLTVPHEKFRAVGMSHAKARYVRNLAEAVVRKEIHIMDLDGMTDVEIIAELTKVKGIGPWTAEMFLIFVLGREDVFSMGDLALKKAIKRIYGFKKDPTSKQLEKIISTWTPYKTYGSRILWESLK